MALPIDRNTSDSAAAHVADHNTLHGLYNELEGHAADTSVHGIADTSALALTSNVVTLAGTQTVTGDKRFSGITNFDASVRFKTNPFVDPTHPDFGADTAAADNTTALNDAIGTADDLGGYVQIPPGTFNYQGIVEVAPKVNFMGAGAEATVLRGAAAGALIRFSTFDNATDYRGGVSGGFTVDGNNVTTNLLFFGRQSNRIYQNIRARRSLGDAVTCESMQNSTFIHLHIEDPGGSGLVINKGSRWLLFHNYFCRRAGTNSIRVLNTVNSSFAGTTREVHFIGGLLEDAADLANPNPFVYMEAGERCSFDGIGMTGGIWTGADSLVHLNKTGAASLEHIWFTNCTVRGSNVAGQVAYRIEGDGTGNLTHVTIKGGRIDDLPIAFQADARARIQLEGVSIDSTDVTTFFSSLEGAAEDTVFLGRSLHSGGRIYQGKKIEFLAGFATSATADTNLYRSAADTLKTDDDLVVGRGLTTAITTVGTGGNPTLSAIHSTALVDASTAARTVNLPTAVGITGRTYTIKKNDSSANAVTVDANGTQTIDGALTYSLPTQYKFVTIQSDGANWVVIGNN